VGSATNGRLSSATKWIVGVGAGTGIGFGLTDGQLVAVAALIPLSLALLVLVVVLVEDTDRRFVMSAVALAFAIRVGMASVVYIGSIALGKDGYTSGDDRLYADTAWYVAQFWRGTPVTGFVPPDWNGYAYLLGTYTYLEAVIFFALGFQLLLMCFLNAALGAACIVPMWIISKSVFGVRAAQISALVIAVFPSLVVFSAVNLKDALNTLLVAFVLLGALRFQLRPAALALACAFVALEPIRGLRNHLFVGLAALVPLAVGLAPNLNLRSRVSWTGGAVLLSFILLVANSQITGTQIVPSQLLQEMERFRTALAYGRTAIEEAKAPIQAATPTSATIPPSNISPGQVPVVPDPAEDPDARVVAATAKYFPIGLAYALFAPFPWRAERLVDVASVPDTLAWYVIMAAMTWTTWHFRSRWRYFAPCLLFVAGLLVLFALVEGNVGTLLRHRSLFMPFAIVVASPALAALMSNAAGLSSAVVDWKVPGQGQSRA